MTKRSLLLCKERWKFLDAVETAMDPMRNFMLVEYPTCRSANNAEYQSDTRSGNPGGDSISGCHQFVSVVRTEETAFVIGVKIYLPFLVLDIIVANILWVWG